VPLVFLVEMAEAVSLPLPLVLFLSLKIGIPRSFFHLCARPLLCQTQRYPAVNLLQAG
jgi:hypothetical protein